MSQLLYTSLLLLLGGKVLALIEEDGLCPLHIYVPFTIDGIENLAFAATDDNLTNNGFSQMAAAVMAARHFNERNSTAVAELEDFRDCPIQIDIENSLVFNTDAASHLSSRFFLEEVVGGDERNTSSSGRIPCAIVGPFHDLPAAELSVMATAAQVPMIAARSYDSRTVSDMFSPYTSSVFPDIVNSPREIIEYLLYLNRTDFIALLYPISNLGFQRREAFGIEFDERSIRWTSSPYVNPGLVSPERTETRSPFAAMKRIQESGYRTIIISLYDPFLDLRPIAEAADALGMNNGQYLYLFVDIFAPSLIFDAEPTLRKLLNGAAWVVPLSEDMVYNNSFRNSWIEQGQDVVDSLNRLNPLHDGEAGFIDAESDFFQSVIPEYGCAFMYDAVMASGIGACSAWNFLDGNTSVISGWEHQSGVRKVHFEGASGKVSFGSAEIELGGTRTPGELVWASLNIRPAQLGFFDVAHWNLPSNSMWTAVDNIDFIYADGTTSPPRPLRDMPEQNYISEPLRMIGLVLMGVCIFAAVCFAAWVLACRKHKVIVASQPFFLYIICFGAMVQSCTIFAVSFDEGAGWSKNQLDQACASVPWLMSTGFVLVYSALFTKLWRINKVLQISRRVVKINHVMFPMVALFGSAILVVVLWTALSPLRWVRREINSVTGESIGQCDSDQMWAFAGPLVLVMIVPAVLTAVFAFKTKDVDASFSESWWVFAMILIQLEVVLISAPVITILRNDSTDGRYLGLTFLLWSFPASTLTLIMFPKLLAYRRFQRGVQEMKAKRGESKGVRVTGIPVSSSGPGASQSLSQNVSASHNDSINEPLASVPHTPLPILAEATEDGNSGQNLQLEKSHSEIGE